MPGLMLDNLDIDAPDVDQPMKVDAAGQAGRHAVDAGRHLRTRPHCCCRMPSRAPFPVDVTFQAAGATASAKGTIADAQAMTGANIALAAKIPDLSALSPLARRPLPALKTDRFPDHADRRRRRLSVTAPRCTP